MKPTLAAACLVSILAAACSSPRQDTASHTKSQAQHAESAQAAGAVGKAGDSAHWSSAIGEAEFKALHELRQDAAPKLNGAMIEIAGNKAYLSLPPNATAPLPGIVVVHEWWGLNDHVKHWADRLAAEGYAAVAVDLYGGVVATTPDEAMKQMKAVDQERANAVLVAAHKFLASDPRILAKKRGSIGWCFGGHESLRLALAAPDLDAAVMYYGFPIQDAAALAPLHADLLGIFGTLDKSIPPSAVAEFDAALTKAGKNHTFRSFDAEHAFANPSNPRYDEKSSAEAWKLVRTFFAEHLKSAH